MIREHRFKFSKSLIEKSRDQSIRDRVKMYDNAIKVDVENIQDVIENIDNQIIKAFKNKQNFNKSSSPYHNYLNSIRSHHHQDSINIKQQTLMIKQHRNVVKQQGNGITLINNKDVMKYVRHIYSFYNIVDPLQKNKDLNSTKKKMNFTSTNKKMVYNIGEETIDTVRTINSARTNRSNEGKIDVENICVSPFFCHQKSQDRTERTHRKVIVLKSKLKINKQISNDLSNEKSWKAIDKQANEYRNMNAMATKDLQQTKSQISPQFRYCFMCQQPILDYNLQFHEDQCSQLQRAYTFTLKQLINILDQKILRLIDEVNYNYIMITNEQIVNQHTKNKQILQKWIVQVKQSFNKKEQDIFDKNNKILEDVYKNDIESKILKKTGCKLEVINKLNWFLRLKNNVQRKYYNQN